MKPLLPQRVLILGATSTIAQSVIRRFAREGAALCLVARNPEKLACVAADAKLRGAPRVEEICADLCDREAHPALVASILETMHGLDVVLVAYGILGEQKAGEQDFHQAEAVLTTNFLSVASILTPLANYFEQQRSGCIAVLSSVAGDRGRRSNYIYGCSKAALNVFLEGMRSRLHPHGVDVLTVKPGFVDTSMTAHLQKTRLFARPETIGEGICEAILRRKDSVYLPWFWRPVMFTLRMVPGFLFKRASI